MSDHDSTPPVAPGDVLAGKYRVERVLGAGGMGVVVQAHHLELDQRVAVKFLLPNAVANPEATARFVREARAAVRIKSEHVARVSDVGRLENGAPYIVMEFLHGADLGAIVQQGRLPLEDAVDYLLQACEAIAEAHSTGIVHRDLKPANLFLTQRSDGTAIVKVLDFGISKLLTPATSEASLTKTSTLMGSPLYMSPEQLRSTRNVDHRTDIWSLGVILYELLTGTLPFNAETLPQLIAAILEGPPRPLRTSQPELPLELEAVVAKALERDLVLRFQSVGELARALSPFAPRRSRYTTDRILRLSGMDSPSSNDPAPPGVVIPSLDAVPADLAHAPTDNAWSGTQPVAHRPRRMAAFAVAGVLAVAALVALLLFARRHPDAAAPSALASTSALTAARTATPSQPATSPVAEQVVAASGAATSAAVPSGSAATERVSASPPSMSGAEKSTGPRRPGGAGATKLPLPAGSGLAPAAAITARPVNPLAIDLK